MRLDPYMDKDCAMRTMCYLVARRRRIKTTTQLAETNQQKKNIKKIIKTNLVFRL